MYIVLSSYLYLYTYIQIYTYLKHVYPDSICIYHKNILKYYQINETDIIWYPIYTMRNLDSIHT